MTLSDRLARLLSNVATLNLVEAKTLRVEFFNDPSGNCTAEVTEQEGAELPFLPARTGADFDVALSNLEHAVQVKAVEIVNTLQASISPP